jgi:AraC-like DNA-binding protein
MFEIYNLNNENMHLVKLDQYYEDSFSEFKKHNLEGIHIFLSLKGKGEYKSMVSEHIACADTYTTNIDLISPGNEGVFYIPKNTHKQSLSLFIKKEYLLKVLSLNNSTENIYEFFERKLQIKNIKNKKLNSKSNLLAHDIFNRHQLGGLEVLTLEARILDLLYIELSEVLNVQEQKNKQIVLSNKDKESIHHAKNILDENLQNPPSIKELAKLVAINEFKLKYGFDKIFNNSPYNLSLENRLNEAKKLLESSELNINEIALEVGYKYPQSFSNAFYKKFGIRPKELMKSRKYYY